MKFGLEIQVINKVRLIKFCNTKKKNAISVDAYNEIADILNKDATDDNIIGTIFTGKDEYFTSGNDLSIKMDGDMDMEQITKDFHGKFVKMITALLKYPKLIVSVVNGPAIGIGFTLAGLSDIVYASNTATFSAPFVKLGLCIEGCGSYLIPRILGKSKATEVLLLGHKITVDEAKAYNLVSKIVHKIDIDITIKNLIQELSELPLEQLMYNKKLMTDNLIHNLLECAEREAKVLLECQTSEYFLTNMMNFMSRRSKL